MPIGRSDTPPSPRGFPSTFPNAQFSAFITIVVSTFFGALTAAGLKPKPQQFPGNFTAASVTPESLSLIVNSGDFPSGRNCEYSSPRRP